VAGNFNRHKSFFAPIARHLAAIAISALAGVLPARAADTAYLKEMPSASRVLQEIKGSDERDTAAKQAGAFTLLIRMMDIRIGDVNANLNRENLPAPERQLMESYYAASGNVLNAVRAKFDPKCQGPNCESGKFNLQIATYQSSSALQAEVNKFFSAQWLADYQRDNQRMQASLTTQNKQQQTRDQAAADAQARALAAQNAAAAAQNATPGQSWDQFMNQYLGYMVFGGLVALYFRRRSTRKVREKKAADTRSLAEFERLNAAMHAMQETNDKDMARLGGASKEARSARIEDIFNRKTETMSMTLSDKADVDSKKVWGTIARPLAAMQARERETLRAAYHLYNLGEMEPNEFYFARAALIFGDGKAQDSGAGWNIPAEGYSQVTDFAQAMKKYLGLTAESAISLVLQKLESSLTNQPNQPTIKLLKERLLGGGTASLSSTADFTTAQNPDQPALILEISEESGNPVVFTREGSAITIAPPGSGKTQCHVFPTLLTWKGPAVVLDVKGEIYAGTSKWRKENVGPVYKFSPLDPSSSASWNPLTAVRSDPENLWEDSRFLADMMMVPSNTKDPFWDNRARDVLTAAIARTCLEPDPSKRSLGDVLDVFHGVGWDKFIMTLQMAVDIRSMTRAGSSLKDMEPKTRDGVLQTGLSSLSAWDGDRIERATRKSDWSPLDLRGGKNPTIYICLRPNEVDSYISVLRVFIAQHIRALISTLPPHGSAPILFLLDEFPRLHKMPPIQEALDLGRQYGIRLWMFAQSLGQLEDAYESVAEGMVGSCAIRMYMNPSLHDETAQKLSDQIGMQEGVLDNTRQKIVEAPVLAGPEYKDSVIVMATGFKPFRLKKSFAYADPAIKARMGSL
jgi:type IV secretion system protein VirD4